MKTVSIDPNRTKASMRRWERRPHLKKITEQIDDTTLTRADLHKGDWLTHGLNYSEDRFSPLDQISKSNVDSLGL